MGHKKFSKQANCADLFIVNAKYLYLQSVLTE